MSVKKLSLRKLYIQDNPVQRMFMYELLILIYLDFIFMYKIQFEIVSVYGSQIKSWNILKNEDKIRVNNRKNGINIMYEHIGKTKTMSINWSPLTRVTHGP